MTSMQEKGRRYAESVNKAFVRIFDELLNDERLHRGTEMQFARALEREFSAVQDAWYEEESEELGRRTLQDYLNEAEEEELLDFLQGFAEKLDYEFPAALEPIVAALTAEGRKRYLDLILQRSPEAGAGDLPEEEELADIYLLRQLLPMASVWKDDAVSSLLLDWYLEAETPDERTAESLGLYFRRFGAEGAALLGRRIRIEVQEGRSEQNGTDYLLQDLTAVCKGDEALIAEAYPVLRDAFRKMEKKQIAAICLGDLGSVRAIPLLRAYIEKNYKSIDRALYYDILSSVQRLGGSTEDLPDPFGDFNQAGGPGLFAF